MRSKTDHRHSVKETLSLKISIQTGSSFPQNKELTIFVLSTKVFDKKASRGERFVSFGSLFLLLLQTQLNDFGGVF